ncbi:hypothetical protein GMLC_21510 [Geomonas limicola]|uniref:DUF2922 domain-containing protein n=1 Tax=Geomonas limicola TaxID=2740186 RepID=A0A6V8N7N4_9BACT|nr:hypothetical protein [Geomonas limicola]GFO68572.1 hypothetical protein GMLC_21510 [Geomonas limicola]
MSNRPKLMVAVRIEMYDGSVRRESVAIPATDPAAACRAVAALARGNFSAKYARPAVFADIDPHQIEDITVQFLGHA